MDSMRQNQLNSQFSEGRNLLNEDLISSTDLAMETNS